MTATPRPAKSNAGAGRDHPDHDHQRHREMRREPLAEQDGRDHENRKRRASNGLRLRQAAQHLPQLPERAVRLRRRRRASRRSMATPTCTPTPVRKPTSAVRDRKSARKPSLKIRASNSRPAVSRVSMPTSAMYFALRDRRHARERAGKDRGGRGVRRHDQMARRAEQGEADQRQQHGIEAGDDRRAGDARVAEHLRDVHRGERHAGQRILQGLARLQRHEALKNGDMQRHDVPFPAATAPRIRLSTSPALSVRRRTIHSPASRRFSGVAVGARSGT